MFKAFSSAIHTQFTAMATHPLYIVDIPGDELWTAYLAAFPEGTNPIFRERTEHDCSCCKQFMRNVGAVVTINDDYSLTSLWDAELGPDVDPEYKVVAKALSTLVKSRQISNRYLSTFAQMGAETTYEIIPAADSRAWNHFHFHLPRTHTNREPGTILGALRTTKEMFERALNEITDEAIDTVLELIKQGSIYRGEEHRGAVKAFKQTKAVSPNTDAYFWKSASSAPQSITRIRNTVIGTLLVDLSNDVSLDDAVRMFESKVAPQNYKRTTALVTPRMIEQAKKTVEDLGLTSALQRRFAHSDDLSVNNVLFVDRGIAPALDAFDTLAAESATITPSTFDRVETVTAEKFITEILPTATAVEVAFENRHSPNLMSLIAPVDPGAAPLFKWGNNFSWAYAGDVTDSIKERVKQAGGAVDGVLRCSLAWFNYDDLDVHVIEPDGSHINFRNKNPRSHPHAGRLDVDMNAGSRQSRTPVENITWADESGMLEGDYKVFVNNFSRRELKDVGFDFEIEFRGEIHTFSHPAAVGGMANVTVAEFNYTRRDGIKFKKTIPRTTSSKTIWGIPTQQFRKVNMVLNSPNHWDGEETGNKHLFFILEGAQNDDTTRGFFNEYLRSGLVPHRKVFELLGTKFLVPSSKNQLSGVGFSSTQRNDILCRVTGAFTRTIKVTF